MVLQCAYIKALRTGRLVYNGGLRLVKPTRRKCFSRKAFIHRFAHTFRLPASYSGGEETWLTLGPEGRFRLHPPR
jgi:hypothetical protein